MSGGPFLVAAQEAADRQFESMKLAGQRFEYGAVGEAEYTIDASYWGQLAAKPLLSDRATYVGTNNVIDTMLRARPAVALRILDLGTGVGKCAYAEEPPRA